MTYTVGEALLSNECPIDLCLSPVAGTLMRRTDTTLTLISLMSFLQLE